MGPHEAALGDEASELVETNPSDVTLAMKTAMRFFLEPKHYRQLHRVLSDQWKGCHSLTAATQLMRAHGVEIGPEEEARLASMDEDKMIETLVGKMPQKRPDQFEHFFLQLSFVASTTTRLRTSLESGNPDALEDALEMADNVGILPYLLKMAVAQAGQEVQTLESEHDSWLDHTNGKMAPLVTTARAALAVQKDLAQAKARIAHFQQESRDKSRSVLLGMAENNDQALVATVFSAFTDYVKRTKREAEIRQEYQGRIDAVNAALIKYREAKINNIKGVLQSQTEAAVNAFLATCLAAWKSETKASENARAAEKEEQALARDLQKFTDAASAKAKATMTRMCAGTDTGLITMAFQSFKQNVIDEKHAKELDRELKEQEAKMSEFMAKQKDGAKNFLLTAVAQNDEMLVQQCFKGWGDVLREEKEAERRSALVEAKSAQLLSFSKRNKQTAEGAALEVSELQNEQLLIFTFCTWKREARIELLRRSGKDKNEKRKKELLGVKGLFKNFASELETNLDKGTPRVDNHRAIKRTGPNAA